MVSNQLLYIFYYLKLDSSLCIPLKTGSKWDKSMKQNPSEWAEVYVA